MNWDQVNSLLSAFKKLNRSLQVQELKAIECKQTEYKFVIAYFFKELKNKTSIALMNKFGVRDDGNRQEFEFKIIEEIKRSGLLFRNIKNEFKYEFYDELINGPAGGVVLAMQFRCDDFDVIFDKLCECKVLETQFMRRNVEHVIRKLLSGGVLNDFGLRICEELQRDIYQSIKEDINSGKYDSREGYHPFYSNERLKEAVDKRNDVNAYKLLCLRDVCDQYYILNRLFTFYEKGIIRNYGCILGYNIKIDLNIFEKFINANKLIGREIFVFLSNFTSLVPADILRIVDIKMVGYLDPFLRKKCSILLPKGYYEIDLWTEQIFLDGMSHESGSKDTIISEEGQEKREKYLTNEKLLLSLLNYKCIKRSVLKSFNPFNYRIETSLKIMKEYGIGDWSFYFTCLANYKNLKSLFLDYYMKEQNIPEEVVQRESHHDEPTDTDTVIYYALGKIYMFSSILVLELNLEFLTADVFETVIGLNSALDSKIYLFLKKENFELLKQLINCFDKTPDSKLTALLKGKRVELQDLKCYLSYDIDFTIYDIQTFFDIYKHGLDENGIQILLQYDNDEDVFNAFQFLLAQGIGDVFKYFNRQNDLIYQYLRNNDLKLCFEYIKEHEKYKVAFLESVDASTCCLEEARIAYELLDRTLTVDNESASVKPVDETENIVIFTKYGSAVTGRLRKTTNVRDGNLYYKCIYNDVTCLIKEYKEHDIVFILSYIRPKDVQPYINDLFSYDSRIIQIHLRDKFYAFVIAQQIECILNERKNEEHLILILENVEKIRLPTLIRLYHHQNKRISDLSLHRLKRLKILNRNLSEVRLKIINYLTDKDTSSSFIDNIVFTSELDRESLEICILLVKKSKNMILAERLLCLTKQSHICEYLRDILDVLSNELIIKYVNELKYVLKEDDLADFLREKIEHPTLENAKLVVKVLEIMEMDVNVVLNEKDMVELKSIVAHANDLMTDDERESGTNNGMEKDTRSEKYVYDDNFLSNSDQMRNVTANAVIHKLFLLTAYAPVLPSFHKYIRYMLSVVFSEFCFENKVSVMCLISIVESTNAFTWRILQFLKRIASNTTSNNKQRILEIIDLIYNKYLCNHDESEQKQVESKNEIEKQSKEFMFGEILFLTLLLKNDNNTVIAKEFSRFFGKIYGPRNIKKYFGVIIQNLNNFYSVNVADEMITKYKAELVDYIPYLSNDFLIRCLYNGFMTKEIIKIVFEEQKMAVIKYILENEKEKIELSEMIETSNFHKNAHLFDDETLAEMFFINYDRDIIKFLRNTDVLYIRFLELSTHRINDQRFVQEYNMLKKKLISILSSNAHIEELLLKTNKAMIIDYLTYQEIVVDHGNLKTLISRISDNCTFLLGKVHINYFLFLNINLIVKYLGKEHFNIFKERLCEITDRRNAALYSLRCYLDTSLRPGVIYCLKKINYQPEIGEYDVLEYYVRNILKASY